MEKLSQEVVETQLMNLGGWSYINNAIEKRFIFHNHSAAFSFMSRIALLAEKKDHHPNWWGVNNQVNIGLSTHEVNGVTSNDLDFAVEIESLLNGK